MLRARGVLLGCSALAVAALLTACSGGSGQGGKTSPLPTQVTPTTSSKSSTPSTPGTPTRSPTSTAGSVSWDQVPAGRPNEWLPEGVSADAPFRTSGDTLPKFSLAMFTHNQAGAIAAANYWQESQNWILAANESTSADAICGDSTCRQSAGYMNKIAAAKQHIEGYRVSFREGGLKVVQTNPGAKGELAIELVARYAAGKQVDISGATVKTFPAVTKPVRLYMRWNGHRWVVGGQYLAT